MALSQKHSGKALVPWFNKDEWSYVSGLVLQESQESWQKGAEVMKIWKLRTPLLSVGVEGTLILLEALLVDQEKLSEFEICQIYSTAVIRFLNICAASNERQGTFYKTAMKNNLPKWLITLRHEIAHDSKVPSKNILNLALKVSLNWIRDKYWRTQGAQINDFVIKSKQTKNLQDVMLVNIFLTLCKYHKLDMDFFHSNDFEVALKNVLPRKYIKKARNVNFVYNFTTDILNENSFDEEFKNMSEIILNTLVDDKILFFIKLTNDIKRGIPKNFRDIWSFILNILYQNNLLPNLLKKLFDYTNNCNPSGFKEVASFWMYEIINGLNSAKNNPQNNGDSESILEKDFIEFSCSNFDNLEITQDMQQFQRDVLFTPNCYTLIFIKELMAYNNCELSEINNIYRMIELFHLKDDSNQYEKHNYIFTLQDLEKMLEDDNSIKISEKENNFYDERPKKFRRIEDTSIFEQCPIGVLPHQKNCKRNPILFAS